MSRKKGWEDSSKAPDWIDCETLMRAIGGLHSAHVALVISPDGIGSTGGVDVAASAILDVLPGSRLPANVGVNGKWPCGTHSTLASHCFSLLYDLDHAIGKVYTQEALWE